MSEVSYSSDMPVPKKMNAWVLKNPEELVQIINQFQFRKSRGACSY